MGGAQFDTLIKRLATTRLTRLAALRGLAAGAAAALTGVSLLGEEGEAKDKKIRICHRGDDFAILGTNKKLKKERGKRHLKKHDADYKGRCDASRIVAGPTPGPAVICTPNTQTGCTDGRVCNAAGTACIDCSSDDQCGTEFDCEAGRCVPEVPPD